ncbi:hypothetical protein E5Z62_20295, partial [Pseudomonas aeruginosa]|uniref:hypothetical protein n=1 Tax=Pseudomonas aeruginosa TaxID=287 RepID=UPI001092F063
PQPGILNLAPATLVIGFGQAFIVSSFFRIGLSEVPAAHRQAHGEGLAGGPRQHTGRRRPGTGPGRAPQLPGESQRNGTVRTRRR